MQYDINELNLIYDKEQNEFNLLDENFNLISIEGNLKNENRLYDIISNIVKDDIIDHSLVDEGVEEIFLFLIEKIYLTDNPMHHRMDWFKGSLNSRTKRNLLIAFNKFVVNNLRVITNKDIIVSYE